MAIFTKILVAFSLPLWYSICGIFYILGVVYPKISGGFRMKQIKRLVGLLLCLAMVLSVMPASIISAAETGTSAQSTTLEKIDLSGTIVGTCSSPYSSSVSYKNQNWCSTQNPGWRTLENFVDGNLSSEVTFGVSPGERGDFYADLTRKNGSAISADQLKLHYGASGSSTSMPTVTIILELADGSEVEKTFTTNWSGTTAADPLIWTFGETYEIEGVYVWSNGASKVSFGEFELYHYIEVPYLDTAKLNGVDIGEEKKTLPAKAELIDANHLYLTIQEGKFHQVKRMLQAVDNGVTALKRVAFGPLSLDPNLSLGEYRVLTEEEIQLLKR